MARENVLAFGNIPAFCIRLIQRNRNGVAVERVRPKNREAIERRPACCGAREIS
jgi:hypothetical protein